MIIRGVLSVIPIFADKYVMRSEKFRYALFFGLAFLFPPFAEAGRVYEASFLDHFLRSPDQCAAEKASNRDLKFSAERNKRLQYDLKWAVPGQLQIGWKIYRPLIAHFLRTEAPVESEAFANAVARWQLVSGVRNPPDGIIDADTLMSIFVELQSKRLFDTKPPEANIVSIPLSRFYDPEKERSRMKIGQETFAAYEDMLRAARKAGIRGDFLKIISGYRSPSRQKELESRYGPDRVRLAKNTSHATGRAIDIYVGGVPVSTKNSNRELQSQTDAYRWLVRNAEKFGFVPYYFEPWHWEYVGPGNQD